jgi:hypothetical protein
MMDKIIEWLKDLAGHEPLSYQTGFEAHLVLRNMAREMLVACMSGKMVRVECDDCGRIRYGKPASDYYACDDDKIRCPRCHHIRMSRLLKEGEYEGPLP